MPFQIQCISLFSATLDCMPAIKLYINFTKINNITLFIQVPMSLISPKIKSISPSFCERWLTQPMVKTLLDHFICCNLFITGDNSFVISREIEWDYETTY